MKKKRKVLFVVMVMVVLCISACSSVPKEKKIKEDLIETSSSTNLLSEGEKIVSVKIKNRKTDKKQKYDYVICDVKTEKGNISYEKEVDVTYYKFDNGWSIQDVTVNEKKDWIIEPLAGGDEEQIKESVISQTVSNGEETWDIESDEISKISIKEQDTDLQEGKDTVTIEIVLNGEVEDAEGILKAEYEFDEKWKLKSLEAQKSFQIKDNAEKALNIDEDGLISELEGQMVSFGETKTDFGNGSSIIDNSTKQEIEIHSTDISEFSIDSKEKSNKGTKVIYECSCKLAKANVQYSLQIEYQYYYQGKWENPTTMIDVVLNSDDVNLSGKWKGTYSGAGDSGTVELDITSSDGKNYTGIYSYSPDGPNGHAGSYEVSGTFDTETMQLKLQAGEWISKPNKPLSIEKQAISSIYYVNSSKLKGLGQSGYVFEVSK